MGLFDIFSRKNVPEVVSKDRTSEIINEDLKKANQVAGFAQYEAPSRIARIASMFGIKPKERPLTDMTMGRTDIPKEVNVSDLIEPRVTPPFTETENKAKRLVLRDWAENLTTSQLQDAIKSNDAEINKVNFNRIKPEIGIDEFVRIKNLENSELQKILSEKTVSVVKEEPEIKVVNTDAVSITEIPTSTNENFVNDSVNMEMERRGVANSMRNIYGKSLPNVIENAIKMRQRSLEMSAKDGKNLDRVTKIEIEELQNILSEIPTLTEEVEVKSTETRKLLDKLKLRSVAGTQYLKSKSCKVMDKLNELEPAQKRTVSAAMLGLSLLSGGTTTAVTKTFTIGSSMRKEFVKRSLKLKQELGRELTKKEEWSTVRKACGVGLLLGTIGGYAAWGDMDEILKTLDGFVPDSVKEFASDQFNKISDMNPFKEIPKSINTDIPLENNTPSPQPSVESPNTESTRILQSIDPIVVNDYMVKAGDSLEKILLNNGFEGSELDAKDKLTKFYNLVSSDAGKALLADSGITDPNNIKPGQHLNLDRFIKLLNQ